MPKVYLRHPKTTQERRCNQDKFDLLVRAKRRAKNLPSAYDDIWVVCSNCWKNKRKTKYHLDKKDWEWRLYTYGKNGLRRPEYEKAQKIAHTLQKMGIYFEWKYGSYLIWYGPDIVKRKNIKNFENDTQ